MNNKNFLLRSPAPRDEGEPQKISIDGGTVVATNIFLNYKNKFIQVVRFSGSEAASLCLPRHSHLPRQSEVTAGATAGALLRLIP